MLKIDNISISYSTEPTIRSFSLNLYPGEIIGIVGASGSGKSSLLKVIAGLLDATKGSASWMDKKVKGPSEQLVPGHEDIQLVNQDFGLDLYHTVWENVIQKMLYLPNNTRLSFTEELLNIVDLIELKDQKAILLSGGEQQRLSIARALASEPDVLLMDEPFSHLDAHLKEKIGSYIQKLAAERNLICVLVSHEGQDVIEWSEKIVFIDKGEVKRIGTPKAFYNNPESFYEARFFGEINSIDGVLFRPNEYEIVENNGIKIENNSARFAGMYWKNKFCTSSGENVVLFSNEALVNGSQFRIKKVGT